MALQKDDIEGLLRRHHACPEALPWATGCRTLEELWESCEAPDWMLWALWTFEYNDGRRLRRFAAVCAERVHRLWDHPKARHAIDLAKYAAIGIVHPDTLETVRAIVTEAANEVTQRLDYSEAMAAAAAAAIVCLRDRPMDAAMDASRESARAVRWDGTVAGSWPEEGIFQAAELRAIVGDSIHPLIAGIRRRVRMTVPIVE